MDYDKLLIQEANNISFLGKKYILSTLLWLVNYPEGRLYKTLRFPRRVILKVKEKASGALMSCSFGSWYRGRLTFHPVHNTTLGNTQNSGKSLVSYAHSKVKERSNRVHNACFLRFTIPRKNCHATTWLITLLLQIPNRSTKAMSVTCT